MVTRRRAKREADCKIVYFGPAASGKTTNLQHIYQRLDPATRGRLITSATESDRTLFFDFLAVELGMVGGVRTRIHLYTVPGQVRLNESRRRILWGVDGLVFVADSQRDRLDDNVRSWNNLLELLDAQGRDLESIPFSLQYNKRDLPSVLPVTEMDAALNGAGFPAFEAAAIQGVGVFECLTAVSERVIASMD